MSYTKEMIDAASGEILARKTRAENTAEEHRRKFAETEPVFNEYQRALIMAVRSAVNAIGKSSKNAADILEEQKKLSLETQENIRMLLKKHDLPENYLEPDYTCKKCSDTGFVDGKMCDCFKELLKKNVYTEAKKISPLSFCRFEDFSLDYYPTETNPEYGCSPRERMADILAFCKGYAADFDTSSQSILMAGETGLGKTHLSLSIAGEVINRGYTVVYNSAQNIFTELNREHFGKGDPSFGYETLLLDCDLLVMDDLGAEFSTSFTHSALYNIINTRINSSLPTIISTNYSLKEIEEKYTRRISSRIIGEYAILNFIGRDIRQLKNE